MNHKTGGNRGPRRAGALAVAAAVAVLAAGCGVVHISLGGSASSSASAPTYAQVLALAQCMRSHGVPSFPDPNASGGYSLTPNGSLEGAGGQLTLTAARHRRLMAIAGTCCPAPRLSHGWSNWSSKSSNGRSKHSRCC